jgi:hypothetical protein
MSHVTRLFAATALLFILAGTVHFFAEGSHLLINLTPVAMHGDSVGFAITIRPIIAVTTSIIAMVAYRLFFGPGPPVSMRSVRDAIVRRCGAGRKARAFPNLKYKAPPFNKLAKMRLRMYSRFYIT